MQVHITIDLSGENIKTQLEMTRKATRLVKEIEKEFGAPEENAPERVEVTPKALEEHFKREERQKEGLETTRSGLDVVEPTMYNIFLNMSCYEFGKFINNWIRLHLKDDALCIGQVERMFQTPIFIYKQQFNHQVKK